MSLYEIILNTMPDGLFTLDVNCRIKVWNRMMEKLTGYRAKEAIGKPCSFLRCSDCEKEKGNGDDLECALLKSSLEFIEQYECTIEAKNGERIPVLKNARVLKDKNDRLLGIVETVTDIRPLKCLEREVSDFKQTIIPKRGIGRLVGKSHVMQEVYERIRLAGNSEATVLIEGETGTGKELIAEAIHYVSTRKDKPLVKVNCSALSENLLESELFGHVKGAFTGAVKDKIGRFELAQGGTIFLDEIGDLSPLIQLKLLRVLQGKEVERVGESVTRKVNVRVIAATHENLRELVEEGRFRKDFFYRLRVFSIPVPPLRKRKEDIPLLVKSFINRFNVSTGKRINRITNDVKRCFMDYCWPGNVRELENAIEHGFVTCQGGEMGLFDLPIEIRMLELRRVECLRNIGSDQLPIPHQSHSADTPEQLIDVLKAYNWNKSETARKLGIKRSTVWRKMKRWGIPLSPPVDDFT